MSEDADAYGEQGDGCYLILANEKARGIINKAFEGAPLPACRCWLLSAISLVGAC